MGLRPIDLDAIPILKALPKTTLCIYLTNKAIATRIATSVGSFSKVNFRTRLTSLRLFSWPNVCCNNGHFMNRPAATDLGLAEINKLYDNMRIDAKWSVWEPRGFTWWGWHSAQRVWSEPALNDDGFILYRLHARAELFDGFENTDQQVVLIGILGMYMTLSGVVRAADRASGIDLAASVKMHEGNLNWSRPLFSAAVAMQAAEASILAEHVAQMNCGLRRAVSAHPQSGLRAEMDEMLDVFKNLVNPEGQGQSRYRGEEMDRLVAAFQPPCVMATGDESGLAAEHPYPAGTSLLRLETTEQNPRAGSGLLATLSIPGGKDDDAAAARQVLDWNEKELNSFTRTHFLGSWCATHTGLTHVTFYPNYVHESGCLRNIGMTEVIRAHWLTEEVMGYSMKEHFEEALADKMMLLRPNSLTGPAKHKGVLGRLFGRGPKRG